MCYSLTPSANVISEVKAILDSRKLESVVQAAGLDITKNVKPKETRQQFSHVINDICHIVGSGNSVNNSLAIINQDHDFVIGFNFAGLLPTKFDVYFIEVASNSGPSAHSYMLHEQVIRSLSQRSNPMVVAKCLWGRQHWSADTINYALEGKLRFLIDVLPRFPVNASPQNINVAYKSFISRKRNSFYINGSSSSIFSVLYAYQLGFRNIVVHGVDFVGPHFFHARDFDKCALIDKIRVECPVVDSKFVHLSGHWMSLEWPHVIAALASRGVTVYSASTDSLFSTYAPVFVESPNR